MDAYVTAKNLKASKPWADSKNAMKLYGWKLTPDFFYPNFIYNYNSSTGELTIRGGASTAGIEFMSFEVRDESGSPRAYNMLNPSAPTDEITLDVSGLQTADKWTIFTKARKNSSMGSMPEENLVSYEILVDKTAGDHATTFNVPLAALSILQHNNTTTSQLSEDGQVVAAATTAAQSSTVSITLNIENVGIGNLTIADITASGAGSNSDTFPQVVAENDTLQVVIDLDTATTGAKTATVVIAGDANNFPGEQFTFQYTYTVV
jgi:hypothetical protein